MGLIWFDLDGVIRDLQVAVMDEIPTEWDCYKDGFDFCSIVENNLDVLIYAPPTEYYDVIRRVEPLRILSCQPEKWRENTEIWRRTHIRNSEITYVNRPEEKLDLLMEGDILVEDFPMFKDYSKILLIDRPYNRFVKAERVSTPTELQERLKGLL